ncbi:MAG: flagellar biosynthesis protein [Clostridiales bacterium]|nr:flagellar biosynthesis protein [Clostridiales bacterium]
MVVINILYNNLLVNETAKNPAPQSSQPLQNKTAGDFQRVLESKIEESTKIQFSKHASLRLSARNINLSGEQIQRVESGMKKAREKGIKDSLVMVDDVALVVNVKSKLVITAISADTDNVFTNIDGAVIV